MTLQTLARRIAAGLAGCVACLAASAHDIPDSAAITAEVGKVMARTHAQGLAIAVVDAGRVGFVNAFGVRDARRQPLNSDTVMYGPYKDLADDARWQAITPRMCLTHSTGFDNFWFIEPDQRLRIHFDPGSRFSYSGEGMILLQFVVEHGRAAQGLGLDVGDLTKANFDRLGMTRTRLTWRNGEDPNVADGWNDQGEPQPHSKRSKVRAAGSMNTTITDLSKFAAALVRGDGLSAASRAEMTRASLHITTAHQFPHFGASLPAASQRPDLAAGLGVVVFDGPQGHGFYKGGHDGQTANTLVCLEKSQRCVLILANDVRAEAGFAELVRFVLVDTGVPYDWEYGDQAGKS